MKRSIAYYHLPGLFEFYELYKVFLPLFREHREYFYDWCDIGSVYGAPADCIWGGGRAGFGDDDAKKVLDLMKGYGISARLTFSNSLLREEHLLDKKCNALCRLFEETGDIQNGVIIHSDLLLEYLKKNHIKMAVASSTRYERVLSNLKSIKVDQFFDAIIGGDQIKHGKPAPDIFLKAVELLEVNKEDALVLEDSRNGILAAHAGKIPVICIPDLIHHSKDILDLTVGCYDSLDQLIDVIVKKDDKA